MRSLLLSCGFPLSLIASFQSPLLVLPHLSEFFFRSFPHVEYESWKFVLFPLSLAPGMMHSINAY